MNKKLKTKKTKKVINQKPSKRNKNQSNMIEELEDETLDSSIMERSIRLFQPKRSFTLNTLSMNVYGYLSEFLGLKELCELRKVNKRGKAVVKNSRMLGCYFKLREFLKKQGLVNQMEIYSQKSAAIEEVNRQLSKKFTESEKNHIIRELIYFFTDKKELVFPEILSESVLRQLNNLLSSERAPYMKLIISANTHMIPTINILTDYLSKTTNLKTLELLNFRFDFMDLENFGNSLASCMSINTLILTEAPYWAADNSYSVNLLKVLKGIEKNKSITHLTLGIHHNHSYLLASMMSNNKTIIHLTINKDLQNYDFLRYNDKLEILEFTQKALRNKGIKSLSNALDKSFQFKKKTVPNVNNINTLIFNTVGINRQNVGMISSIVERSKTLQKLEIHNGQLVDVIGAPLFEAIKNSTSLRILSLIRSRIDANGFHLLKEAIRLNNSLEEIDLSDNWIYIEHNRIQDFLLLLNMKTQIKKINLSRSNPTLATVVEKFLFNRELSKIKDIFN
jgi:hypothetical protein